MKPSFVASEDSEASQGTFKLQKNIVFFFIIQLQLFITPFSNQFFHFQPILPLRSNKLNARHLQWGDIPNKCFYF